MSSAACGTENLLAEPDADRPAGHARRLPARDRRQGRPRRGAVGRARRACSSTPPAGTLTYDLGGSARCRRSCCRRDANDSYKIFGAIDGHRRRLTSCSTEVESVVNIGHGLRTRPVTHRADRRSATCASASRWATAPTPSPSSRPTAGARPRSRPSCRSSTRRRPRWSRRPGTSSTGSTTTPARASRWCWRCSRWRCSAGASGSSKQGRSAHYQQAARRAAGVRRASISFVCYFNFGAVPLPRTTSTSGTRSTTTSARSTSKSSPTTGSTSASRSPTRRSPALRRRVELRKVMNLRTNMMEGTQRDPGPPRTAARATSRPSAGRTFKKDVAHFRAKHDVKRWEEAADRPRLQRHAGLEHPRHDCSPTPGRRRRDRSARLHHPDRSVLHRRPRRCMSLWAFGWRTTCVALAVFATNFPSRFYWTGGAFLRWDWLFYFVGGLCLVKKDQPVPGRLLPRLLDAAAHLPGVRLLRADPGGAAAAVGDAQADSPHWRMPSPPSSVKAGASSWQRSTSRSRSSRCASCSRASIAASWRSSAARRSRRDARADQPRHEQRHRRLQGVQVQHREAQGDAAHQPHGAADGRDLQPVARRAGSLQERPARRSVGALEEDQGRHVQAPLASSTCCSSRGLRRLAVRGAAPRTPSRGSRARWAR